MADFQEYQCSDIVCFAAKGGNNYESHNHNDVGNFILHVNGESLLTDLGAGEYTKQYFGPERYSFLCNNSLGHSVPLVEGCGQGAGAAVVMDVQISPEKDLFILDISRVYKNNNLKSLVRSFVFNKTGVSRLILKDEYSFQNVPTSVIERLISFRQPELISEGTLRLIGERGSVDILFNPEEMEYSLCEEVFVNHHSISENIYIINLSIKKPDTRCMAEIQFMVNKMGLL